MAHQYLDRVVEQVFLDKAETILTGAPHNLDLSEISGLGDPYSDFLAVAWLAIDKTGAAEAAPLQGTEAEHEHFPSPRKALGRAALQLCDRWRDVAANAFRLAGTKLGTDHDATDAVIDGYASTARDCSKGL